MSVVSTREFSRELKSVTDDVREGEGGQLVLIKSRGTGPSGQELGEIEVEVDAGDRLAGALGKWSTRPLPNPLSVVAEGILKT